MRRAVEGAKNAEQRCDGDLRRLAEQVD